MRKMVNGFACVRPHQDSLGVADFASLGETFSFGACLLCCSILVHDLIPAGLVPGLVGGRHRVKSKCRSVLRLSLVNCPVCLPAGKRHVQVLHYLQWPVQFSLTVAHWLQ